MQRFTNVKHSLGRTLKANQKNLRNWYEANLYVAHHLYIKQQTPLVIFTPGKVGSTSIYESLPQGTFWIQSHSITPEKIHEIKQNLVEHGIQRTIVHQRQSLQFYNYVAQKRKFARYITMFRDPISRNLSAFFQQKLIFREFTSDTVNVPELIQEFLDNYPHDVLLNWFDEEYKQMLDIDIYEYPFNTEHNYTRIEVNHASILLMRTELDDASKEEALSDFLNIPNFRLKKSNVSGEKNFGEVYQQIKSQAVLPKDYIDRMIDAKYTQHFFSETEREQIRSKWMQRLDRVSE